MRHIALIILLLSSVLSVFGDERDLKKGETITLDSAAMTQLTSFEISWKASVVPSPGQEKTIWSLFFGDDEPLTIKAIVGCEPSDRFDPRFYFRFQAVAENNQAIAADCSFFGNKRNINPRDRHNIKINATHGGMSDIIVDNSVSLSRIKSPGSRQSLTLSALEKMRVSDISIKRAQSSPESTKISIDSVRTYLSSCSDSVIGTFSFLDRQNDQKMAEPGGFYNLVLIPDNDGYLIVYLGGARVEADSWEPGMIKGRLRPTRFKLNYDLEWIDSRHEIMRDEQFAVIVDNMILELHFPLYDTVMRFSRTPIESVLQAEGH